MGSTQMYSLSWGEFGSSLASTVRVLRGHGELIDVTLAAGGRIFPAHKLVLSAASPLLMELLKSTGCQHPVVMLAGVTAHDLEALLQFVYNGEVSIDPTQLPSLLQAAHCLDIQALSPSSLTSEKMVCQSMSVSAEDRLTQDDNAMLPVRKRKRKQRRTSENGLPNKWAHLEPVGTDNIESTSAGSLTECKEESSGGTDDNNSIPKKLVSDQPVECSICGVVLKQSRNLRRHMALIHMKVSGGRTRKSKKQVERIKKEGVIDSVSETDNSVSSNSATTLLRSLPTSAMAFSAVGLISGALYSQSPSPPIREILIPDMTRSLPENQSHRSTPPTPPIISLSQSQEQIRSTDAEIISIPSTSTTLCDSVSNTTFVPTTMQHPMHFTHDSLFRHQNELTRNESLYNITDTREQSAND